MSVPFRVPIGVTLSVAPGGAVSVREVRWRDGRTFPIARSLPSGRVVDDDTQEVGQGWEVWVARPSGHEVMGHVTRFGDAWYAYVTPRRS